MQAKSSRLVFVAHETLVKVKYIIGLLRERVLIFLAPLLAYCKCKELNSWVRDKVMDYLAKILHTITTESPCCCQYGYLLGYESIDFLQIARVVI